MLLTPGTTEAPVTARRTPSLRDFLVRQAGQGGHGQTKEPYGVDRAGDGKLLRSQLLSPERIAGGM